MKVIIVTVNGETSPNATLLVKGEGKNEMEATFKSFVDSIPKEYRAELEYIQSNTHITGECVPFGITDFQIRIMDLGAQETGHTVLN